VKSSIFCRSIHNYLLYFTFVCFALFFQTGIVSSQTSINAGKLPIHVLSDKMIARQDSSMVEFIGNVKVTREDSVVFADSIKIYFIDENSDKDKNNQSNVKKIVSVGNVIYTSGERKAYADQAVYTTLDEALVLTGKSPKLITGSSFVTGKKITLFKKQDKVIIESDGTKRVEALFNPEYNITEKDNAKNNKN